MLLDSTTIGYDERQLVGNDASSSQDLGTDTSSSEGSDFSQNENQPTDVELEGKGSNLAAVEYSRSMASEATHNVAHLSPTKRLGSYPEDIASPQSGVLSTISDESEMNQNSAASKPYTSRVSRMLAKHRRVPGGAAAKLIGRNQEDECIFFNEGDDAIEVRAPVEELMRSREQVVAEFSVGSAQNKRYHTPRREESENNTPKKGSLPRILDRDEFFHDNATAAIVSILTPANKSKNAPEFADILTAKSTDIHMSPSNSSMKGTNPSPFSRPATKSSEAVDDAFETMNSTGKNPLVQHLLTKKTERHLAAMKDRMKDPTKNLTDLMEAIASPSNGLFDRHYMVRRKNACGALKVMAGHTSQRVNICWTVGVLPALTSVLEDSGSGTLKGKFPSAAVRREFVEARKRALSTLVYLVQPKNNRLPIFHCPRLVASLVRVIEQDDGDARQSACSVLAQLSKSKENRLIMAQVPGLVDAVMSVIKPKKYYSRSIDEESVFSHSTDGENSERDIFEQLSDDIIEMALSNKSPRRAMSEEATMPDVGESSARYDEDPDPFLRGARQNVFALLIHLTKEMDNEFVLARNSDLIRILVEITKLQESSSQEFGLKVLANLSRHRSNSNVLVFKMKEVVPAIVLALDSNNSESTKFACYCLQNFSQDKPCRQQLASIENLLPSVCRSIRDTTDPEQKLAALHTLKNLTDEPANLIPMSNTPDCFATLIQVAHAVDESITEIMQYVACDALATLSHWFRSIATSGQRIGMVHNDDPESFAPRDELFVPSQRLRTWEAWE